MASVGPLGVPSLPLGRLGSSHFWRRIDASLADRWSIRSWPSLFLLLEGRLRPVGLVLLHLQSRARLGVHCEAGHLAEPFQLHRPERMEFAQLPIRSGPQSPKN